MKLILADPNTIIKLFNLDRIKTLFGMTQQVYTCPFTLNLDKIGLSRRTYLQDYIQNGKLHYIETDIKEIKNRQAQYPQLDCCERNNIYFALANRDFTVLSNEGAIRNICQEHQLSYIDISTLFPDRKSEKRCNKFY